MGKSILKILAWSAGSLLSLTVLSAVIVALSLSWLGTDPGRQWIARQVEQRVNSDNLSVELGTIQIFNSRHIMISDVMVKDEKGVLGRLDSISLSYNAAAVLTGAVHLYDMNIDSLFIDRLPAEQGLEKQRAEAGKIVMPALPKLKIDHFNIKTISLAEGVTGQSEDLALQGRLLLSPSVLDSIAVVSLSDKRSGQELADVVFNLQDHERPDLRIRIQDKGSGLVSRLASVSSLDVTLEGSGDEKLWEGRLVADIEGRIKADNAVRLDLSTPRPVFELSGESYYGDLKADGKTVVTLPVKGRQASLSFHGVLGTPKAGLKGGSVNVVLEPERHGFKAKTFWPLKLSVKGDSGTVVFDQAETLPDFIQPASFEIVAKVFNDKINIEKSRVITAGLSLSAQGTVALGTVDVDKPQINLTVQSRVPDLSRFAFGAKGSAQAQMIITGSYQPALLEAPVEIKLADFSLSQDKVDLVLGKSPSVKALISYKDGYWHIAEGLLTGSPDHNLIFSGRWRDGQTDMELATDYQGYALGAHLIIKGKRLAFQNFTAQGSGVSARGQGTYDFAGDMLQAELSIAARENMSAFFALSGPTAKLSYKGYTEGTGAFPYRFDFDGKVKEQAIGLDSLGGAYGPNNIKLQNPVDVVFAEEGVSLKDMVIHLNDGTLTANGIFTAQSFKADMMADNIPTNFDVFPFLFEGRMDGRVSLSGPYKQPEGKAQITLKRLAIPGLEQTQDRYVEGQLSAVYKDHILQAQTDLQGPAALKFKADARLPLMAVPLSLSFDKPVQASLASSVDLRALTILLGLDEQRIKGQTMLDVTLSGTLNNPVIKGQGQLREGAYDNIVLGTAFKDISADIAADANRLRLTKLEGKDRNGGRFSGHGHIEFSNIREPRYEFSLKADHLQLVNLERMGLTASGQLNSAGEKKGERKVADIKGEITVNAAEYYIGEIVSTSALSGFEIVETNGAAIEEIQAQKPEEGPDIALSVKIEAENNVFVRGPDLETEWEGRLSVSGSAADPSLRGRMNLIRGSFQLLDTPVLLSKGAVSFVNPDPANPAINVAGTIKGREMDAIVKIGGEAQKPEISLTSDPPLPEDEVLAKTLFGKSLSQLSPMQALRIAQLMAYLSGRKEAGFDPLNKIRRAMGVDTLSVGLDEEKGATLSVGKYINDRVYIGVDQGATPESSAVRAEIGVTEEIEMETVTGGGGESSVGVNWKRDY